MIAKVWAYIVRQQGADVSLLVFEHVDVEAGIQIPAGTVEANEDLNVAVEREVLEESGTAVRGFVPIGIEEHAWYEVPTRAHLFATYAPPNLPDEWEHHVTGAGEDNGMRFHYYWLPRSQWTTLMSGFQLGIPVLNQFLFLQPTSK
jgi:hypothetical protein